MSTPKRRPVEYASPDLSSARVARMWDVIEKKQRAGSRPLRVATFALAACMVFAVLTTFALRSLDGKGAERATTGDVIVTEQTASALTLPDGSSLQVGAATELSVLAAQPSEIRLHLKRGSALCDVVHRSDRRFIVETDDLTVQVKGTRFAVEVQPGSNVRASEVSVRVERGLVEVRRKDGALIASLGAGQRWSQERADEPAVAPDLQAAPDVVQEEAAPAPPVVAATPAPEARALGKAAARETSHNGKADAGALLERANTARLAGRALEAAQAYDRLRETFPRDARAGLAAFELARIRLDSLDDARGALSALRFALSHQAAGFVAEDAEALQIDALTRLGDTGACRAKQSRFLARHPQSAHRARVSHACGD